MDRFASEQAARVSKLVTRNLLLSKYETWLFKIELNHIVARDNTSCRSKKRKCSPLRLKSVTTATIHSLRSDREDLHAITILIRFCLKTISLETQEIVTYLYVRLLPITDSISSRDAENPAQTLICEDRQLQKKK